MGIEAIVFNDVRAAALCRTARASTVQGPGLRVNRTLGYARSQKSPGLTSETSA